jgi:CrcB protein
LVATALLVMLCGGAGSIVRFAVDGLVQSRRVGEFPLGTCVVNLSGCLALGLLDGLHASHRVMLILGTATLGSYTTFSTWILEAHRPAQDGESRLAWLNIAAQLFAGLAAVWLGRWVGRLL